MDSVYEPASLEQWLVVVAERIERLASLYGTSGMGRSEFCQSHGIALSTLNRHLKKQQNRQNQAGSNGVEQRRLVAVAVCGNTELRAAQPSSSSAWGAGAKGLYAFWKLRRHFTDRRLCGLRPCRRTEDGACRMLGALKKTLCRGDQAQSAGCRLDTNRGADGEAVCHRCSAINRLATMSGACGSIA